MPMSTCIHAPCLNPPIAAFIPSIGGADLPMVHSAECALLCDLAGVHSGIHHPVVACLQLVGHAALQVGRCARQNSTACRLGHLQISWALLRMQLALSRNKILPTYVRFLPMQLVAALRPSCVTLISQPDTAQTCSPLRQCLKCTTPLVTWPEAEY